MNEKVSHAGNVRCPRCDYDLRGVTMNWRERCPLAGRCPECGLEIDWREIFHRSGNSWLFEYQWRHRPVRSAIHTIASSVIPDLFWRRLRLTTPWARAPSLVLPALALFIILFSALVVNVNFAAHDAIATGWRRTSLPYSWIMSRAVQFLPPDLVLIKLLLAPIAAQFVLVPFLYVAARRITQEYGIRRSHVMRATVYSLLAPLWALAVLATLSVLFSLVDPWTSVSIFPEWIWRYRSAGFSAPIHESQMQALVIVSTGAIIATWIWLGLWWSAVTRRYLRVGAGQLPAILILTILFVGVIMMNVSGDLLAR